MAIDNPPKMRPGEGYVYLHALFSSVLSVRLRCGDVLITITITTITITTITITTITITTITITTITIITITTITIVCNCTLLSFSLSLSLSIASHPERANEPQCL